MTTLLVLFVIDFRLTYQNLRSRTPRCLNRTVRTTNTPCVNFIILMVGQVGFEPTRYFYHWSLNPMCLPISPLPQIMVNRLWILYKIFHLSNLLIYLILFYIHYLHYAQVHVRNDLYSSYFHR